MLTPARREEIAKRLLIAFSLSNLCFMAMWIQVLTLGSPGIVYYRTIPSDWGLLVALVLDVAIVTLFLYACLSALHHRLRWVRIIGGVLVFALSLFALNEIRHLIAIEAYKHVPRSYVKHSEIVLLLFLAAALLLWGHRKVYQSWLRTLLIVSPLGVVLFLNAFWLYRTPQFRRQTMGKAAGMLSQTLGHPKRVVWVIFDELDEWLTFDGRPQRIQMPEFDRLRQMSLSAPRALAPAGLTLLSIPSLISGRRVTSVRVTPYDLNLQFRGSNTWSLWSKQPNIFGRARSAGFDTGLSGWYHAYCRVLGKDLSTCAWNGSGGVQVLSTESLLLHRSLLQKALYLINWQARSAPFVVGMEWATPDPEESAVLRNQHTLEYQTILHHGMQMLKNSRISLLLLHFPIPHPSGMWNAREHRFPLAKEASDYLDNLELVDKTLGKVRQTLQQVGDWDNSTLLVSADHPLRPDTWSKGWNDWPPELQRATKGRALKYVPFLLKLPDQTKGFTYPHEFNTVVSQALLWEILNGHITTPEGVADWLNDSSS